MTAHWTFTHSNPHTLAALNLREEKYWAIAQLEIKKKKKKNEIQFFFRQRHALSISFGIFVVTNFLPKLILTS